MAGGKRVFRTHATKRTETRGVGTGHEYRTGFSYCDPNRTKKTAPSASNDWRGSTGIYSRDDQSPRDFFNANCPDCAKAWGKEQLAHLGDRIRFEPFVKSRFKSAFTVYVDGVERAVIGIGKGFGLKWTIFKAYRKVRADSDDYGWELKSIDGQTRYDAAGQRMSPELFPLHFSARDALASQVLRLIEDGWLPSVEEQKQAEIDEMRRREEERQKRIADDEERARQRVIDAENREKARIEREAEKALALDALGALLGDERRSLLSNSEIAGLEAARKLLS